MNLRLWLRFALRDLRSGLQGFWIFLTCLALGTVKTYCQRLYRKVRVSDQRELALAVVGAYLELRPETVSSARMTSAGRRPRA